jgi:predicted transposase/invertase (TIGR01784 family)
MVEERLNPLNDFLFMKYMGEKGDEEQLTAFLNVVLSKTGRNKIVSVTILDKSMPADIIGDKSSVLDVRAQMDDGTKVNIEVQLRNVSNMDKRSLFYWSREYAEGMKKGEDYMALPNVITINILGTEFLSVDEFHASFHLWEDTHKDYLLTGALEMHFIDMVKFGRLKEKDIEHNELHRWLTFFDKNTGNQTIEKIVEMDTAIKKVQDKITFVAQDSNMLHEYRMREMAVYDFNNGMRAAELRGIQIGEERGEQRGIQIGEERGIQKGEERGIQKGEERGIQKGITTAAVILKQAGFSAGEIANFIGQTAEETAKILKENG